MSSPVCTYYVREKTQEVTGIGLTWHQTKENETVASLLIREGKVGGRFRETRIPRKVQPDLRQEALVRIRGLLEEGYIHVGTSGDWKMPKPDTVLREAERSSVARYFVSHDGVVFQNEEQGLALLELVYDALERCGVVVEGITHQSGEASMMAILGTTVTEIAMTRDPDSGHLGFCAREYGSNLTSAVMLSLMQGASALLVMLAAQYHTGRIEISGGDVIIEPKFGPYPQFHFDLWTYEQLKELAVLLGVPRMVRAREALTEARVSSMYF